MGMQDKDGRMLRTYTHASEMQWLKEALKDDRVILTPENNLLFTPTSASGMHGSQSAFMDPNLLFLCLIQKSYFINQTVNCIGKLGLTTCITVVVSQTGLGMRTLHYEKIV